MSVSHAISIIPCWLTSTLGPVSHPWGGWRGRDSTIHAAAAAAAAESLQSCPTLCDPRDSSPPGSPVPGILQARTLEWVAISFSNAWKWEVKGKSLSRVWPSATPWTAAYQALPSMGFSMQEYWSGVPSPSPSTYINLSKNSCSIYHVGPKLKIKTQANMTKVHGLYPPRHSPNKKKICLMYVI